MAIFVVIQGCETTRYIVPALAHSPDAIPSTVGPITTPAGVLPMKSSCR